MVTVPMTLSAPKPPQTTPFSAFCTAIHSFVTGEPRDFKIGALTYHSKSHPADEESSLKGAWSLHNFDLFRACRTSSFCTVAWQLARFQLTRRIARSLGDSFVLFCSVYLVFLRGLTTFTTFISPVLSLTTLSTRCSSLLCYYRLFSMHLQHYSFVLFLASAFLLQSTTFCSSQPYGSAHHTSPHHTANQQYSHLNRTTFAAALLSTRSRSLRFRSLFLLLSVLLSGDIELNPGPSAFTLCTLNIRSILHPLHSAALSDRKL